MCTQNPRSSSTRQNRKSNQRQDCIYPIVQSLENRRMMSVTAIRSIDGTGNNLADPTLGAVNVDLLRKAAAAYADGISTPAGASRPSARAISDAVATDTTDGSDPNSRNMSAFVYAWGQFLDHDLDLTTGGSSEVFNVAVPAGDPYFDPNSTGTQVIDFTRSNFDPATGTSTANPRQQENSITAYIDGSVVYGSDPTRAAALRTFVGGLLKTSAGDLMPFNTDGLPNANDAHIVLDNQLFLAGDVRANENIELTALQTLFVREHNRLATQYAQADPSLTDEQLYQKARAYVIGEIESITYNEFLPALLGQNAIAPYRGYNPNVNPDITTEFSTAGYRFGHSMLGNDIEFLDNNGNAIQDPIPLAYAFFNPGAVEATGIDPIIKYLASDNAQEVDTKVVNGVQDFLFGPPGSGGFDLASLNIQRGRDHGLADYNTTRAAYGLPRVTSFAQITSDPALQAQLKSLYGNVNNIDLWVGGLAEDHVRGSSLGPLDQAILVDQFTRTRNGDRFWFENTFSGQQLNALEHTSLSDIIERNTTITNLQSNVFFFNVTLGGNVTTNAPAAINRNFRGPTPLGGWTVLLEDSIGAVLQSTTTARDGSYSFTNLALGTYKIREVLPAGWTQMSPNPGDIHVAQGLTLTRINFSNSQTIRTPQPPPRPGQNFTASTLSDPLLDASPQSLLA
jgi:peroxidase